MDHLPGARGAGGVEVEGAAASPAGALEGGRPIIGGSHTPVPLASAAVLLALMALGLNRFGGRLLGGGALGGVEEHDLVGDHLVLGAVVAFLAGPLGLFEP